MRNALRYFGAQNSVQIEDEATMTRAQRAAHRLLQKAEEGETRALEVVMENLDGKLPTVNLNADLDEDGSDKDIELTAAKKSLLRGAVSDAFPSGEGSQTGGTDPKAD